MLGEEEEGNDLETGRIRTTLSYAGEGKGPGLKGMLLSIVQGVLGLNGQWHTEAKIGRFLGERSRPQTLIGDSPA